MPVDIVVVRSPGDKKGSDIVDPILSNVAVCVLRGTVEIQDNEPSYSVSLKTNYRVGVRKGHVAEVIDSLQGKVWRGRITGVSHSISLADSYTSLTIEKPRG